MILEPVLLQISIKYQITFIKLSFGIYSIAYNLLYEFKNEFIQHRCEFNIMHFVRIDILLNMLNKHYKSIIFINLLNPEII
jgi:hypothetical protein